MPQVLNRSSAETSSLDSKSSTNAIALRKPGSVPIPAAVAAVVGLLAVVLVIAWAQGWFGQSYAPNKGVKASVDNSDYTEAHAIGKKRNKEIEVFDSAPAQVSK